jgi:deazaflavin-dependent oxidoreductase (nitroreductase family)
VRDSKPVWLLLRGFFGVHEKVYKGSGGRIGHRIPGLGAPMLLLDHRGAKSGIERTTPLLYVQDGENMVIVASKGGHPKHPAWFHNLKANPETTVQRGTERIPVTAHVATDAERDRLWPKVVKAYRGYNGYQERTERKIPLVILEPR